MVFVLKKQENGQAYYYLAHNLRQGKKWKSLRKYIGKNLPSKKALEKLKHEFAEEFNIQLEKGFQFLDKEKLENIDFIISELQKKIKNYPKIALDKMERDFTIRFTFDTNAIEGNSISLIETSALLEKKIVPQGKSLREIYEITNTEKALNFLKKFKGELSKRLVLKLHKIMMQNIDNESAGKFRNYDVAIQGANWMPVRASLVEKSFNEFMQWHKKNKKKLHPIELAAISHLKFIEVHPFGDGNGRIGRLIMNQILMKQGYPPLNIKVKDTIEYIKVLQFSQNTQKFDKLIDWFLHKLGQQYSQALHNNQN